MMNPHRPTRQELLAATGKTVPDVIAPRLKVLFCGINPGLYTAAVGHHFARPGNRFWPALHGAGYTQRLLSPFEEPDLLRMGYGVTNLVARATASATELADAEYVAGRKKLEAKVRQHRPQCLAVLGMGAYRTGFGQTGAVLGQQRERIGETQVWVLPNPSGLNANYQMPDFVRLFQELREEIERA